MEYLIYGFAGLFFVFIILKVFGVDLFEFPWGLLDPPEKPEKTHEAEPQISIDVSKLPPKIGETYSDLKDLRQLFTEDKRYEVVSLFPGRVAWLEKLEALERQLYKNPELVGLEALRELRTEGRRIEMVMEENSFEIPPGTTLSILAEDGRSFVSEFESERSAICEKRQKVVSGGRRHSSLLCRLMSGDRVVVMESDLHGGGPGPSAMDKLSPAAEDEAQGKSENGDEP